MAPVQQIGVSANFNFPYQLSPVATLKPISVGEKDI